MNVYGLGMGRKFLCVTEHDKSGAGFGVKKTFDPLWSQAKTVVVQHYDYRE
jgi:hypothetical protein